MRPPFDPGDPHAHDFVAWERQLARRNSRGRLIAYATVYAVVALSGGTLILLHDTMLGIAVLVLAAVITLLWQSER